MPKLCGDSSATMAGLAIVMLVLLFPVQTDARQRTQVRGGSQEAVLSRTDDEPATTTDTTFSNLSYAKLRWFVPAGDRDLLNVKFTAECRLIGGEGPSEWVELFAEIITDVDVEGYPKPLEPYDTASPMAFCSQDLWSMHQASWAEKTPRLEEDVTYTVRIRWRVTDAENTGWLDDWLMELHVSN